LITTFVAEYYQNLFIWSCDITSKWTRAKVGRKTNRRTSKDNKNSSFLPRNSYTTQNLQCTQLRTILEVPADSVLRGIDWRELRGIVLSAKDGSLH